MKKIITLLAAGTLLLSPLSAFANEGGTLGVGADIRATVGSTSVKVKTEDKVRGMATTTAKARADQEIDRRVKSLNELLTRVQGMKHVSDSFKTSFAAAVNAQISTLTTLKAKIDADTDTATLRTDIQSITKSYRIYALIMPQGRIAAAADRVGVLTDLFVTLGGKLQTRITEANTAGKDVSAAQSALTDFTLKVADAKTQAAAALTATASLTPDNGDKTKAAANEAALKTARTDLKAATDDLKAARKDVETIRKNLRSVGFGLEASTTVKVETH